MAIRLSTKLRNNMLNNLGFKETFDGGLLAIFSGSQPASADAPASGTLLAYFYSDGVTAATGLSFDAPVDGVIAKAVAQTWSGVALANGVAGWFRFMQFVTNIATTKASGVADDTGTKANARVDGSIGTSGTDMTVSSTNIVQNAMQLLSTFNITLPAS